MTDNNDNAAVCIWTYQVDPEAEGRFRDLLRDHWPMLHRLELVTDEPARILRSIDSEPLTYVEMFTWGPRGMRPAHDQPEVTRVWDEIRGCLQPRPIQQNVPGMTFPLYEDTDLGS